MANQNNRRVESNVDSDFMGDLAGRSRGPRDATAGDRREAVVQLARARMRAGWYDADQVLAATIERMLPSLDD